MSGAESSAVPERELRCDHICLKHDGHVEEGTPHFYGYEIPSPRAAVEAGSEPTRDEASAARIEAAARMQWSIDGGSDRHGKGWEWLVEHGPAAAESYRRSAGAILDAADASRGESPRLSEETE